MPIPIRLTWARHNRRSRDLKGADLKHKIRFVKFFHRRDTFQGVPTELEEIPTLGQVALVLLGLLLSVLGGAALRRGA